MSANFVPDSTPVASQSPYLSLAVAFEKAALIYISPELDKFKPSGVDDEDVLRLCGRGLLIGFW